MRGSDFAKHASLEGVHRQMMRRYFDDGWSTGAVAKAFGRSPSFVMKLVRREKTRGRRRLKSRGSPDPRKRDNRRPLSPLHSLIGVRVLRHRRTHNIGMTAFGLRVRLSRFRVGELESGAYDLTLLDVLRLSDELRLDPRDLLAPRLRRNAR